jgi:two-component system, NtrC family, sensor kinase
MFGRNQIFSRECAAGVVIWRDKKMSPTNSEAAVDLRQTVSELQQKLHECTLERDEALAQQVATAEVMEVINSLPGELAPVFDAMLEKAMRLCEAAFGHLDTYDGKAFHTAAVRGVPAKFAEFRNSKPITYGPGTGPARMLAGEHIVYHLDLMDEDVYRNGEPNRRALVDLGGARSSLQVALRKDETFLGFITLFRQQVRPFTEKQGALLQNFAGQAVIAMENARLLDELRQRQAELARSVDELTAITDVLKIISRSPSQLQPVLDTIATCAVRLCGARMGAVYRFDGGLVHLAAHHNYSPEALHDLQQIYPRPPRIDQVSGRAILTRDVSQIEDSQIDPLYRRELAIAAGWRSQLAVPMLRDGEPNGAIVIARSEAGRFSDAHIEVLKTFADQAVIAI